MKELFHNYISNPVMTTLTPKPFNHLESVGQTYNQHFNDSMKYSWMSLKSSFYFFCHGFYPDIFETRGSETITDLNAIIQNKMFQINDNNN